MVAAVAMHPAAGGSNSEIALWAVGSALVGGGIGLFIGRAISGTDGYETTPVARLESRNTSAATGDRHGTAISAPHANQVAKSITNYGDTRSMIRQEVVDELSELIEQGSRVYGRLDDPAEHDESTWLSACESWHKEMQAFFASKLSKSYYTRMHTHSGLVSFSGGTRLSWSPDRIKWRHDLGNDLKRLGEILADLQQRVG